MLHTRHVNWLIANIALLQYHCPAYIPRFNGKIMIRLKIPLIIPNKSGFYKLQMKKSYTFHMKDKYFVFNCFRLSEEQLAKDQ